MGRERVGKEGEESVLLVAKRPECQMKRITQKGSDMGGGACRYERDKRFSLHTSVCEKKTGRWV